MKKKKETYTIEDKLIYEIEKTKKAYQTALSNLENIVEPDLIDCYIYELNAAQVRYKFLLLEARNQGLRYSIYQPSSLGELPESLIAVTASSSDQNAII